MPVNIDDFLKHQLYLERRNSEIVNSNVYPSLDATYKAIRKRLMAAEDINTPRKLRRVVRLINDEIDRNAGWQDVTSELMDASEYESGFQSEFIATSTAASIDTPTREQVEGFVDDSLMTLTRGDRVQSAPWSEFVEDNIQSRKRLVDGLVRQGYSQGDTVQQIARRIRQASQGIMAREAETLARTGFNHYMTGARRAMADAQSIPMIEIPVVTFDNRTSETCMGISARYQAEGWPAGESPIGLPPYHYNCRTTIVMLPEGESLSGTRTAVGGEWGDKAREKAARRDKLRYRGRKDSDVFDTSQVRASTTYNNWLDRQPAWFQNDTLGPARARLFREGMPIQRFTDMTGRKLTLAELRQRDSELFERAGL